MLGELHIRNFVLFEDAHLAFAEGLTVISGETGAGKSLVATALSILLGTTRFQTDFIREGADTATLVAAFHLPEKRIAALRRECDLELPGAEEDGILIERSISRSGRGRTVLCGLPVPAATAHAVAAGLLDIFAQNEHIRLRENSCQLDMLDAWGKVTTLAGSVAGLHRVARELLDRLEGGAEERRRRLEESERLAYQIDAIDAVDPQPEADARLDDTISALEHADALREFCARALQGLYEADGAASAVVSSLAAEADKLRRWSTAMGATADALGAADSAIADAVRTLRDGLDAVDADPAELERLADRRHALRELCRRHGCELADLPGVRETLSVRKAEIDGMDMDEDALLTAFAAAAEAFRTEAAALRAKRAQAAGRLAKAVEKHLVSLGMEHARFAVELVPAVADNAPARELVRGASARGTETADFRLLPNPGEAWSSLREGASGGETSRTLLAVSTVLSGAHRCGTLFFDEIDAGVGGRLGDMIGERLQDLARERQVICITHLPQVAGHGDRHLRVTKRVSGGRTRTEVTELSGTERVEEIASMIRGDASRSTTLQLAREILGDRQ